MSNETSNKSTSGVVSLAMPRIPRKVRTSPSTENSSLLSTYGLVQKDMTKAPSNEYPKGSPSSAKLPLFGRKTTTPKPRLARKGHAAKAARPSARRLAKCVKKLSIGIPATSRTSPAPAAAAAASFSSSVKPVTKATSQIHSTTPQKGFITDFDSERGCGFIQPLHKSDHHGYRSRRKIQVHSCDIEMMDGGGTSSLEDGEIVEYVVARDGKGGKKAIRVKQLCTDES